MLYLNEDIDEDLHAEDLGDEAEAIAAAVVAAPATDAPPDKRSGESVSGSTRYYFAQPQMSTLMHCLEERRRGSYLTSEAADCFNMENILCGFYRKSSLAKVYTPSKFDYTRRKRDFQKIQDDGLEDDNTYGTRESSFSVKGSDVDYLAWCNRLGIPLNTSLYLNEQREYNKSAPNNYNLWPHFKIRRLDLKPRESTPAFASKFSPLSSNDNLADRQALFITNRLVSQSVPGLRLGHLLWTDHNIVLPKSVVVEPFRPAPECLRLLVRKHAHFFEEYATLDGETAIEKSASRLINCQILGNKENSKTSTKSNNNNDVDNNEVSSSSSASLELGKNGSLNSAFLDTFKYAALESMLGRHLEGVVDSVIHSTFDFFTEYFESLAYRGKPGSEGGSKQEATSISVEADRAMPLSEPVVNDEADEEGADSDNDSDYSDRQAAHSLIELRGTKDSNNKNKNSNKYDADASIEKDDNNDYNNDEANMNQAEDSNMKGTKKKEKDIIEFYRLKTVRFSDEDSQLIRSGGTSDSLKGKYKKGKNAGSGLYDKAAFNSSTDAVEDPCHLVGWEDILCMLQERADDLVDAGANNLAVHPSLPDLRLTPSVIQRTQNRILSLFAKSDKACDLAQANKVYKVAHRPAE